jgi:gamma-D-glutamyl-L-lysine dipeptidyl-peptidase
MTASLIIVFLLKILKFTVSILCIMRYVSFLALAAAAFIAVPAGMQAQEHSGCKNQNPDNQAFEKLNKEVRSAYAPDERDKTYQVRMETAKSQSDQTNNFTFVLRGSTTETAAKETIVKKMREALAANHAGANVQVLDSIDLLPSAKLNGKIYGIICMSVASFNCDGDFSAESGTQALMGMPVKILEQNEDDWYRCINMEGYTAWVIGRSVTAMNEQEYDEYMRKPKVIVATKYTTIYREPSYTSLVVSDAVWGDILIKKGDVAGTHGKNAGNHDGQGKVLRNGGKGLHNNNWVHVAIADGREGYIRASEVIGLDKWISTANPTPENIVETAKQFTGYPYVWGGTSVKGIDCSGLAKTSYFLNGYVLRRDASQQCKTGDSVDVAKYVAGEQTLENLKALQPGDLLFFGRKATAERPAHVSHVGIYVGNGIMIHSSDIVRINTLIPDSSNANAEGDFIGPDGYNYGKLPYYRGSGRLLMARRIIGNADQGKGIISVKKIGLTKAEKPAPYPNK